MIHRTRCHLLLCIVHYRVNLALMKITNNPDVDLYSRRYPDAAGHLRRWRRKVLVAQWRTPHDVPPQIRRIGNRRLIFNISKNRYRLIAGVNYQLGTVRVLFFGTHAEYIKANREEV